MQRLIERIRKIQNGTRNLGWGADMFKPIVVIDSDEVESQAIVTLGHNVYKTIKVLFLEKYNNGFYRVYEVVDKDLRESEVILTFGEEDDVIKTLITKLKEWFPEVRAV